MSSYPSESPITEHAIRIKFTEFSRIDAGRRFVESRLLLDSGLRYGIDILCFDEAHS